MSLVLTDLQLDQWIEKNGLLPAGYGQLAAFMRRCEHEEKARNAKLRAALNAPDAWPMMFTGRYGLEQVPF